MIMSNGVALDIAPQALGEVTPSLSNGYFYARDGLDLSGKHATYSSLYRVQPSIATVVDKIANSAARLSIRSWDFTPKTGKVIDNTSAYARLLARPTSVMSPYSFWRWTLSTYEVYGEAFWYKVRDDNDVVVDLLPMHPTRTMVERDKDGDIVYVFSIGVASAGLLKAPAADVVPFLRYNPDSLMRGMSRLEPLRSTLLNEDAARRATGSWWRNGARPSVFLSHPGELSEGAHRRIKQGIQETHAGADNMGKAAVLEEGMTAQVVQLSAEEMQYIESRKLNLQEVCMVYDVPPPVIHILDHATYSNITEQMRSMYRDTMAPRLEDVESVIDHFLRPEFFAAPDHAAKFALDEVLRGDFEVRADSAQKLVNSGIMKPSEARPLFDLPDAGELADHLYANAALVPLGSSVHGQEVIGPEGTVETAPEPLGTPHPAANPTTPIPGAAPAAPAPKRFDVRSIAGRVGIAKAAGGNARDALVNEHRQALGQVFDGQRAQARAMVDAGHEPSAAGWDDTLAAQLADLGEATARSIGSAVAKGLGGKFDVAAVAEWVRKNAVESAANINATTIDQLKAYLASPPEGADPDVHPVDAFFAAPMAARALAIAASRVAMVSGAASLSAAGQSGAATKTWVTGPNPRREHAEMDGETVPIGDNFSNGMTGPGDPAGGGDEVAGCNCSLEFTVED